MFRIDRRIIRRYEDQKILIHLLANVFSILVFIKFSTSANTVIALLAAPDLQYLTGLLK